MTLGTYRIDELGAGSTEKGTKQDHRNYSLLSTNLVKSHVSRPTDTLVAYLSAFDTGRVFSDQQLSRSLFSIADYCNQDCTAVFTKTNFVRENIARIEGTSQ